MNLASGEFRVTECTPELLETELHRVEPAELLCAESLRMSGNNGIALTALPDWHFESDGARDVLHRHFSVDTLAGFGLVDLPVATCAAGALLRYVSRTQTQSLSHIQTIRESDCVDRKSTRLNSSH